MSRSPSRSPSSPQGALRILLWIVYDALWLAFGGLVYGTGLLAAGSFLKAIHGAWGWVGVAMCALPAYALFLVVVVLQMGLVRWLSPRVEPGVYEKFKPGPFFALVWLTGLNNLLQAVPLIRTVNFLAITRYLYYRGQGMKTHYENWISPQVLITDPFLISLGHNVNIGDRAAMGCHLALPDRMIVAPIVIGDDVVIGTHALIAPGVEIGRGAMIGAAAGLSLNVKVGEGALIEAASFVPTGTIIGPYERWGGHPARKLGMVREPDRDAAREPSAGVSPPPP